jgi:hypothetical protein
VGERSRYLQQPGQTTVSQVLDIDESLYKNFNKDESLFAANFYHLTPIP